MNLKSTVTTGAPGTRSVEYILNQLNQPIRRPAGDAETPTLFALKVKYVRRREVRKISEESVYRRIGDASKASKVEETDEELSGIELCKQALVGWTMTVAGMRALQFEQDLAGFEDGEPVEFTAENVDLAVKFSNLHNYVYTLLADYDFWFPSRREREKNSVSGPSGSSAASPVAPASPST